MSRFLWLLFVFKADALQLQPNSPLGYAGRESLEKSINSLRKASEQEDEQHSSAESEKDSSADSRENGWENDWESFKTKSRSIIDKAIIMRELRHKQGFDMDSCKTRAIDEIYEKFQNSAITMRELMHCFEVDSCKTGAIDEIYQQFQNIFMSVMRDEGWVNSMYEKMEISPIGLIKLPLIDHKGCSLRLHFFDPKLQKVDGLHTHKWEFESVILYGNLRSDDWEVCDADEHEKTTAKFLRTTDEHENKFFTLKQEAVHLKTIKQNSYFRGDSYYFPTGKIHEVLPDQMIANTATLVLTYPPSPGAQQYCYDQLHQHPGARLNKKVKRKERNRITRKDFEDKLCMFKSAIQELPQMYSNPQTDIMERFALRCESVVRLGRENLLVSRGEDIWFLLPFFLELFIFFVDTQIAAFLLILFIATSVTVGISLMYHLSLHLLRGIRAFIEQEANFYRNFVFFPKHGYGDDAPNSFRDDVILLIYRIIRSLILPNACFEAIRIIKALFSSGPMGAAVVAYQNALAGLTIVKFFVAAELFSRLVDYGASVRKVDVFKLKVSVVVALLIMRFIYDPTYDPMADNGYSIACGLAFGAAARLLESEWSHCTIRFSKLEGHWCLDSCEFTY